MMRVVQVSVSDQFAQSLMCDLSILCYGQWIQVFMLPTLLLKYEKCCNP